MIEPMRKLSAGGGHGYRRVVVITSAQSGKTDSCLSVIGERFSNAPVPVIYVGPSRDFNTDQFEPRLMTLLDEAPTLSSKVSRGQKSKKTRKLISGVSIRLAHAGSPTALKSDPACLAIIDEYDGMAANVRDAGDPLGLVEARGFSFADFVVGVTSTPTLGTVLAHREATCFEFWAKSLPEDLTSQIWRLWQEGSRFHWAWPCKHCNEFFIPRFSCLKWDHSADPHSTTPSEAGRTAHVVCPRCGGVHVDADKVSMNARGVYVAPGQDVVDGHVVGNPPESSTLSYWISGLASPFVTWGQRAENYLSAVRAESPDQIQTAINAGFGELFAPGRGRAPEWAEITAHCSTYLKGEIPAGVQGAIVMSVDVQASRLIWLQRLWCARAVSYLINWGTIHGDTDGPYVWDELERLVHSPVAGQPIKWTFIDSGFRPGKVADVSENLVYEFCYRFPGTVMPTKGSSSMRGKPITVGDVEYSPPGKKNRRGLKLYVVNTDTFKRWLFDAIRRPAGQWFLPADIDEIYLRQMISESRKVRPSGYVEWIRHSKENHALDCEALQLVAAYKGKAHLISEAQVQQRQGPPPLAPLIIPAQTPVDFEEHGPDAPRIPPPNDGPKRDANGNVIAWLPKRPDWLQQAPKEKTNV
jgi:phage terminase large subunit GpA-like protein